MSMNRNNNYWTNVSSKPKNFQGVNREPLTYAYKIPVVVKNGFNDDSIDMIDIKIKVKLNEHGNLGLNIDYFKEYLNTKYGIVNFSFREGVFIRDGATFPIVNYIVVEDKDLYFKNKKNKERHKKLANLLTDDEEN